MATPALRALRERFADARITFLLEPNLKDLVAGGDWMDECVEWPAKRDRSPLRAPYRELVRTLRDKQFDLAVLLPNSFRAAMIAKLAGAHRRVGYDRDGRRLLLTDPIPCRNRRKDLEHSGVPTAAPGRHQLNLDLPPELPVAPERFVPLPIVEYYADLVEAIGAKRPADDLHLFTTPDCEESLNEKLERFGVAARAADSPQGTPRTEADAHAPGRTAAPLVVFSPGAKFGAAKCWFPDRFGALGDRLIEALGATVAVTCGPGEEPIARAIRDSMQQRAIVFDEVRLSLGELKSLIARADLLVCNDAGPRHFAKAFGVPLVTIFGPTHPEWTDTSHDFERIVRVKVPCGPCQQKTCPLEHLRCIDEITVDAVFEAATSLLETHHPSVEAPVP